MSIVNDESLLFQIELIGGWLHETTSDTINTLATDVYTQESGS